MLAINFTLRRATVKALVLTLIHGVFTLFSFVSFFFGMDSVCRMLFFSYLFLYSVGGLVQTILEYRIPRMNLFQPQRSRKVKWLIIGLLLPVGAEVVLAVMWWARWPYNPLYCMFCEELGLPLGVGLAVTAHSFMSFVLYVQVGHAYTKRKYFLICIGGPQNQIIREDIPALMALQLRMPIAAPAAEQYQHFDDRHDQPPEIQIHQQPFQAQKHQGKQCPICLQQFSAGKLLGNLPCHHNFHYQCISQWLMSQTVATSCPVCRTNLQ